MSPRWDDVNARVRGLGLHLFRREAIEALASASDVREMAARLRTAGLDSDATPHGIDLAIRRRAARRLATLARWCAERTGTLAVVFEDEDRRSLRAILRGAAQGAAPELRLAGTIPTPSLPERALAELARLPDPGSVAALLAVWGHPYGAPLLDEARPPHPDLLRLEVALERTFAARALAAARGRGLRAFVREEIDLGNAWSASLLAGEGDETPPADCFVEGGDRLDREAYRYVAAAAGEAEARRRLAKAFSGSPLAAAFRGPGDPAGLEHAALAARLAAWRSASRLDPLGPALLLVYVLRLRAETADLRRAVWGRALGVPPRALALGMVSA